MASILFSSFICCGYIVHTSAQTSATVDAYCDNEGQILHSNDGIAWTLDAAINTAWQDVISAEINDVSPSTMIRVQCTDVGHTGGFVGQVTYAGQQYYSLNPITSSYWSITAAAIGSITSLEYFQRSCCPAVHSQAWWIWNGQNGDTLTFDFDMSQLITATPTATPTAAPITTTNPTGNTNTPTAVPTTSRPTLQPTPSPSEPPTNTPIEFREAEVSEELTDSDDDDPESEEANEAAGTQLDTIKAVTLTMGTVLMCLFCICVFLVCKWKKEKNKTSTAEGNVKQSQGTGCNKVVAASNAFVPYSNATFEHKVNVVPGAQNEENQVNPTVGTCVDCGVVTEGKTYESDKRFYCLKCWERYE